MALTDDEIESFKGNGKKAGIKRSDGKALYIQVTDAGRYWRMNYIFAGRRKTLALGVYPEVTIADARLKRDRARSLLANGIDPSASKKEEMRLKSEKEANVRPKHPGAVLRETVLPGLEVTHEHMAKLLNVSHDSLVQLLGEHQPMNCNVALQLERILGISAESWMTMQLSVDLWDARQELSRIMQFGQSLSLQELLEMPGDAQIGINNLFPTVVNAAHLDAAVVRHKAGLAEHHDLTDVSDVRGASRMPAPK